MTKKKKRRERNRRDMKRRKNKTLRFTPKSAFVIALTDLAPRSVRMIR